MTLPKLVTTVVLAGTLGARLFPLTSTEDPKHLLPVGGVPLLARLLLNLTENGIETCIVVLATNDTVTAKALLQHPSIKQAAGNTLTIKGALHATLVHVPEDIAGSADALRYLADEQQSLLLTGSNSSDKRILVLPGDLLMEGEVIYKLLKRCSSDDKAACTMLLADVGEEDEHGLPLKESSKVKKGGFGREEEEIEYTGYCKSTGRVLLKQTKLDVEQDEDLVGDTPKLIISKTRSRCGPVTFSTDWNDLHVYMFAPWILRLLQIRTNLVSLREEVLPLLIGRQYRGLAATLGSKADADLAAEVVASNGGDAYTVCATVLPRGGLHLRSCTLGAYLYACRDVVIRELPAPEGSTIKTKDHTLLLPGAILGEKVTCKSCTIGKGSKFGNKCRLNNVVVMDGVTVGDNCVLQNSILGHGCTIGDNCNLNDCQVGVGAEVPTLTKEKGESFMK